MQKMLVVLAMALSATPAFAQERELGMPGSDVVLVFQDSAALSEALRLINAGVHKTNQKLVNRLLSCVANAGDKGVVTDGGFTSSTIVVTSGKSAGCRGVVVNEDLRKK